MVAPRVGWLHRGVFLGAILSGVAAALPARGDAMYNVTQLGAMTPIGIDNQGQVYLNQSSQVAYEIPQSPGRNATGYTTHETARRYQPSGPNAGAFTDLGANVPTGQNQTASYFTGFNPGSAQVVSVDSNGQALVFTSQGAYLTNGTTVTKVNLTVPPETNIGFFDVAPIGSGGGVTVAGYDHATSDPNGSRFEVLISQNGNTSNLALPGGQQGIASAVGPGGQIVGSMFPYTPGNMSALVHAFLAQNGTVTDLGTLGGIWSRATGVNASGLVVGWSATGVKVNDWNNYPMDVGHAFLYTNGQMKDLGTLNNDPHSIAYGINAKGQPYMPTLSAPKLMKMPWSAVTLSWAPRMALGRFLIGASSPQGSLAEGTARTQTCGPGATPEHVEQSGSPPRCRPVRGARWGTR